MTDHFALMGEPRRPWLDGAALKGKFLTMSGRLHPDHGGGVGSPGEPAFAELNAAYQCLRDPRDRLRHLLTLETGAPPGDVDSIVPELAELFVEVGSVCREVDLFLGQTATVQSPLLKVQAFERGQQWREIVENLSGKVDSRYRALEEELRAIDAEWELDVKAHVHRRAHLDRLQGIYRWLSYLKRWSAQLEERRTRVSMVECIS